MGDLTKRAWKDAIQACRTLGIKVSRREISKRSPYVWNGKSLTLKGFSITRGDGASNFWHEIAHWLVSPPERRSHAEFGLGPGIETHYSQHTHFGKDGKLRLGLKPTVKNPDQEEADASALGCYLLAAFGHIEIFRNTVVEHSWDTEIQRCVRVTKKCLSKLDLSWAPPFSIKAFKIALMGAHKAVKSSRSP